MESDYSPIDLDQFELVNVIGKGQFGEVYRVKDKLTGVIYAAKISLNFIDESEDIKGITKNLVREINIISKLNHPSIFKFIGFSLNDFQGYFKPVIITEFMSKGSLSSLLESERDGRSDPKWDDTQKLITLYGIASAMSYLHSHNIIHRDLKPDNILMDDELYPKISDFGLSKILHQNQDSITSVSAFGFKGTVLYIPPEIIINDSDQTKSCDVYAFAMIAYELITLEIPFGECNWKSLFKKLQNGIRPEFKCPINESYQLLIEKCWSQDPSERPTFDEIEYELKTNPDFITELIEEDRFLDYIDYIDEYKISFNSSKPILSILDFKKRKMMNNNEEENDDNDDDDAEIWENF